MRGSLSTHATARRSATLATLALVATALLPAAATAQSGADLLQEALDRYEARTEGIDSYTVVQQAMGMQTTQRFVKQQREGHPVFVPEGSEDGMGEMNPWAMFPRLAERAELTGTETVNGVECHVLHVGDLEGLDVGDALSESGSVNSFQPDELELHLGTEDYLIHRMRVTGTAQTDMGTQQITLTADLGDYREVEGFIHPYRMDATLTGLGGNMSEEEKARSRRQLQQLQEQLESMPEQQRAQMEQMLGPQIEKLEKMLDSGTMEFSVTVQELRVNTPATGGGSGGGSGGGAGG